MRNWIAIFSALLIFASYLHAQVKDKAIVTTEHAMINVGEEKTPTHTLHPDAQWFPGAGLGFFIHWGLSSVKNMDISWPMIPGRALANKKLDSAELIRVVNEKDYNLNGKPPGITPNEYWAMAK